MSSMCSILLWFSHLSVLFFLPAPSHIVSMDYCYYHTIPSIIIFICFSFDYVIRFSKWTICIYMIIIYDWDFWCTHPFCSGMSLCTLHTHKHTYIHITHSLNEFIIIIMNITVSFDCRFMTPANGPRSTIDRRETRRTNNNK